MGLVCIFKPLGNKYIFFEINLQTQNFTLLFKNMFNKMAEMHELNV